MPKLDPVQLAIGRPYQKLVDLILNGDVPPEIIIDGPAGTGKTMAIGFIIRFLCENFPGIRVGLLRKVRSDLADTVLRTWEEFVLGPKHYAIRNSRRSRENRRVYVFKNGSEVVVGGMDRHTRLFSAEYDIFWVNELIELAESDWEYLTRAMRNYKLIIRGKPVTFRIGDTNPREPSHWANQRPKMDGCMRIVTRHWDNAGYYDYAARKWTEAGKRYIKNLQMFTGVRKRRLLKGEWCAAEGAIWPEFDHAVHVVPRARIPKTFSYYVGAQDYGFANPGCLQVWGVQERAKYPTRAFMLKEVYQAERDPNWWADWVVSFDKRYRLLTVECDGANPERISLQNKALGISTGRDGRAVCVPAVKDQKEGFSTVNAMLNPRQAGGPRLLFVEDALVQTDQDLLAMRRPIRTTDEIDSYVYKEPKNEDDPLFEVPDPTCVDHGCDTTRYAAMRIFALGGNAPEDPKRGRSSNAVYHDDDEWQDGLVA